MGMRILEAAHSKRGEALSSGTLESALEISKWWELEQLAFGQQITTQ